MCILCKKRFISQKELKNHHLLECGLNEVVCNQCLIKFPRNQLNFHNCNPINGSLQMIDYFKDSNQNLIKILNNFSNNPNLTERQNRTLNSNNINQGTMNADEMLPQYNNLYNAITKLASKIEEKFNYIIEEIKEIKQEKNLFCHICKSRKTTDTCVNCNLKFCEMCSNQCKICEINICNKCPIKFEKCKENCKNFLCKICLKIMNGNKKFKIVEHQFEKENLCTKDICCKSRSRRLINSYTIGVMVFILLILYICFK